MLFSAWYNSYRSLLNLLNVPTHLLTVLLVYFIFGLATRAEIILPQYTSLLLSWPLSSVNMIMALRALISALTVFALPTIRKTFLEPHLNTRQIDLFITQFSLIASSVGAIGMGISTSAGFFALSLCIYTSGVGFWDSLTAYGAMTLPPGEKVSEFYARTGLIYTITALTGSPLWSAILNVVLKSDELPFGLPFWLCAMLFCLGVIGVTFLMRTISM